MTVFQEIRESCQWVASVAKNVHIDKSALDRFAVTVSDSISDRPDVSLEIGFESNLDKLNYVVLLDAINFGSGWFPSLNKPVETSGYKTISRAFLNHCHHQGVPSVMDLRRFTPEKCSEVFLQNGNRAVWPLMQLFAQSWNELGEFIFVNYSGRLENLILEAQGLAENLIDFLIRMPLYRDVSSFQGKSISFYKRAQITCADLHSCLMGSALGSFSDIDELTMFADNLVPHVLRHEGVLVYKDQLSRKIKAGLRLPSSSPEEVEIRALAVTAVEALSTTLRNQGHSVSPRVLDEWLWRRGQKPEIKSSPRHRTYSPYY